MLEIIPNWHPLFVHFPIALLSMATLFFLSLGFFRKYPIQSQLRVMAYWNLWLGTGFAVIAATAGWFAYNSVAHDTVSHVAMTDHRNWALVTLTVYIFISLWSVKHHKRTSDIGLTFIFIMLMAFVLLASTGWRGSEAVYRYGLGVMSMPKSEGDGHAHEHPSKDKNTVSENKNYEIQILDKDGKSISKSHIEIHDDRGTKKVNKSEHKHSSIEKQSSESSKEAVSDHDKTPHTH